MKRNRSPGTAGLDERPYQLPHPVKLGLLVAVFNVPFLQDAFGTTPLTLGTWALLAGAALTIVPVVEVAKWVLRRRGRAGGG